MLGYGLSGRRYQVGLANLLNSGLVTYAPVVLSASSGSLTLLSGAQAGKQEKRQKWHLITTFDRRLVLIEFVKRYGPMLLAVLQDPADPVGLLIHAHPNYRFFRQIFFG